MKHMPKLGISLIALAAAAPLSGQSDTAPAAAPATEAAGKASSHLRVILLGTGGGPQARADRAQPANLIEINGAHYMIDVGVGALGNLSALHYDAGEIDGVFITHNHLDHAGGLADFIQYSAFSQAARPRMQPVAIVGPADTKAMVRYSLDLTKTSRRIFGSAGLMRGGDPSPLFTATEIVRDGLVYSDLNIKVFAAENTHYSIAHSVAPNGVQDRSYSYRIETSTGVVVFTGDSGPSEALTRLARGADLLVSEIIDVDSVMDVADEHMKADPVAREQIVRHMRDEHMEPEVLGRLAAAAGVKMLALTHLPPGLDDRPNIDHFITGIRKYYAGPVLVGRDQTVIAVGR